MRTNGLVGYLVIALGLVGQGRAADQATPSPGGEFFAATLADAVAADELVICGQDSPLLRDGWRDFLIGSTHTCHLYAGTELTALQIDSQTGGRITLSFSDTTAPGVSTVAFNDASGVSDRGYAPRLWVGANLTDKWGARGRFWNLSDSNSHFPDLAPGTTPTGTNFATISITDHVEAWNTDIEAVRTFELGGWKMDGFVGGRHAHFATDSDLLAFGVFTTGNFVNLTLQNGCAFNGSGVTYGGSLRRQLGCTPLYAFGSVRGSNLDGRTNSLGRSDGTVADSPSAPLVGAATVTRNNAVSSLGIFEFQAGLDFEWPLQNLPVNFFFRAAYEYQNWVIDGPPTGGAGFGGTIGELTTNSFASAGLGGMTLSGVSIGTGLTW